MINPLVSSLNKSATLKITALTKKLIRDGRDVVNLAAGEPDFDTPEFIKQAAIEAIRKGFTKYTPSAGMLELREAIAGKCRQENSFKANSENVIVTSGAKYAIFAAIIALAGEGSEVIVPSPYWVSYPEMIKLSGSKMVPLVCPKEKGFKINPAALDKAITGKTSLLILNYPANPTGVTYSKQELEGIYEVVKKRKISVISDEIYEALVYDGRKHTSFASFPGADAFTVTVGGFSKTFSMTGWRMGYLVAPAQMVSEISKIIDHTTSCASSISQKGALAVFGNTEWPEYIKNEFQKRRDLLWEGLAAIPGLQPIKTQGTFYMFCGVKGTGMSSVDFATRLLDEQMVSCIPADSFNQPDYIRFSFSTSLEQISKGIDRIKAFLKKA
ncbi:MAG: pyridoxal phosphate-dependent aminotransferase [Candidatus Omnitrophica bacterium]|nr:pyridoxal phosphate-dependent aminotransferase [Candidatus Omnitrophota bacterium]MDD5429133.1 pyridoxal phosphate-dependent aminotransferase [Candidatus Omnitrophota bacterium]